jgi:hypothetical protein
VVYIAVESSNTVVDPAGKKICGDGDKHGATCWILMLRNFPEKDQLGTRWRLLNERWTDAIEIADNALEWCLARQDEYGGRGNPHAGVNLVLAGWPCVGASGLNRTARHYLDSPTTGDLFRTLLRIATAVREAVEASTSEREQPSFESDAEPEEVGEERGPGRLPKGTILPTVDQRVVVDFADHKDTTFLAEIRASDAHKQCGDCSHGFNRGDRSTICKWCYKRYHATCVAWHSEPELHCGGCEVKLGARPAPRYTERLCRHQYDCIVTDVSDGKFKFRWEGLGRDFTGDACVGRHRYVLQAQINAEPLVQLGFDDASDSLAPADSAWWDADTEPPACLPRAVEEEPPTQPRLGRQPSRAASPVLEPQEVTGPVRTCPS